MPAEMPVRGNPDINSDHGRVYKWLKAAAVDYRFRPGEQIMIGELAERLRVSSTPVRETLIRLQTEALLETAPRRGFFAKTLNLKEMIELIHLRFLILKSSLEQAADLIGSGAESASSSIFRAMGVFRDVESTTTASTRLSSDQLDEAIRCIEKITESVVALCQNEVMLRALGNVNDRARYVCMIDLETAGRLSDVRSMLEELCLALQQKDVAGAVSILRKYRDELTERMPALVKEGISRAYTTPSWILLSSRLDPRLSTSGEAVIVGKTMFRRR